MVALQFVLLVTVECGSDNQFSIFVITIISGCCFLKIDRLQ